MKSGVVRVALVLMGGLLFAGPGSAKKSKDDRLDRLTPVPADQPIPIIDFFRPPVFISPELNPAGTHFAALVSTGADRADLATFELASKKIERLTGGGTDDIESFQWLNDRRLAFSISRAKLYSVGLFAVELGRLSRAYPLQEYNVVTPVGFPRSEPDHAIIWIRHSAADDGADGGVLRIDTRPGHTSRTPSIVFGADPGIRADIIHRYPPVVGAYAIGYLPDYAGELAYAIVTKGGRSALLRLDGSAWSPCPVDLAEIDVLATSDQPDELLVLGPRQESKPRAAHRINTVTGKLGEVLLQDDAYDIVDAQFQRHPVDGRILGVHYVRKGPHTIWFDPTRLEIQTSLQKLFPDRVAQILGGDRAENHFFIRAFSDVSPPAYYQVDLASRSLRHVTSTAPWIEPARMRPMQMITCKARDGHMIEGYVTLPSGASREAPAPLVVLPHGGPWARDAWGWDPEVQFLASRGYAVFQPNYRGSSGTAWRFPTEDLWDFRKMHDDVTDGLGALRQTGLVDGERMAIMGASFGGYLALCGVAYETGLYRCALSVAGVFDWEQVLEESRRNKYQRGVYDILVEHLGDPRAGNANFEAISPLRAVGGIKVPVFVAHGAEDNVASVKQSKRLIAELKKHGVPFEKQIERGEGHGFRKLENQVELYGQIEEFLARHLAPRPAEVRRREVEARTSALERK